MKPLWAFLLFAAGPAAADFDAEAYPAYETCALCHGLYGQSRLAKFPHLAGQKPGYVRAQIEAFLAGERSNDGGQMAAIVLGFPSKIHLNRIGTHLALRGAN